MATRVPMTDEDRAVIHQIARRRVYANIIVLNSMFCGDNTDATIMAARTAIGQCYGWSPREVTETGDL